MNKNLSVSGGTSIDTFLEKKKYDIPTFDPYTGEINVEYESLTGKKNPLLKTDLFNKSPLIININKIRFK